MQRDYNIHIQSGTSNPKVYYNQSLFDLGRVIAEWSKENKLTIERRGNWLYIHSEPQTEPGRGANVGF